MFSGELTRLVSDHAEKCTIDGVLGIVHVWHVTNGPRTVSEDRTAEDIAAFSLITGISWHAFVQWVQRNVRQQGGFDWRGGDECPEGEDKKQRNAPEGRRGVLKKHLEV